MINIFNFITFEQAIFIAIIGSIICITAAIIFSTRPDKTSTGKNTDKRVHARGKKDEVYDWQAQGL